MYFAAPSVQLARPRAAVAFAAPHSYTGGCGNRQSVWQKILDIDLEQSHYCLGNRSCIFPKSTEPRVVVHVVGTSLSRHLVVPLPRRRTP